MLAAQGVDTKLALPLRDISIAVILHAVEEPLDATRCQGQADCQDGQVCITHHLWDQLNHQLSNFLEGITLESLIEQQSVKTTLKTQDPNLLNLMSL